MHALYEDLTRERRLRADELVYAAAEHVPQLPTREQVAAEREHLPARGVERHLPQDDARAPAHGEFTDLDPALHTV